MSKITLCSDVKEITLPVTATDQMGRTLALPPSATVQSSTAVVTAALDASGHLTITPLPTADGTATIGVATVTVTVGDVTASIDVTVQPPAVTQITIADKAA